MIENRNNSSLSKIGGDFSFTFISLSIPAKKRLCLGRLSEPVAAVGLHGAFFLVVPPSLRLHPHRHHSR